MANEGAFAVLDNMITTIREMPQMAPKLAPAAAQAIGEAIRADLAAGRDPGNGVPWEPRKEDGGKPMRGAAGALQISLQGTKIVAEVGAPYVFHHYGVRGATARHVVPDRMTIKIGNAVRLGIVKPWRDLVKGRV